METKEVLSRIERSLSVNGLGASFSLKVKDFDYSLSKLCSIAEEHGMQIVGLYINELENHYLEVNFKLNRADVLQFANSLKHHSFIILSCTEDISDSEELESSYKLLMDFINN